jgi:hypothetical protein
MKAYTLAAILFRVLGVLLLFYSIRWLTACCLIFFDRHNPVGVAELFPVFLRYFVFGIVVYFAAPLLAKMAAWKIRE